MYKKIFAAVLASAALTSCTEDFTDWVNHENEAAEVAKHIHLNLQAAAPVVLADVTTDSVQILTSHITTDEAIEIQDYYVILSNGEESIKLNAGSTGNVATAELATAVKDLYGRRPVAREIASLGGISAKAGNLTVDKREEVVITVTPDAPVIEDAYYVTGTVNGWDNTNTDYVLTNGGGDVYDNPVFTGMIPAEKVTADLEFKLTPKSGLGGDWSGCLTIDSEEGKFADKNAGGNFSFPMTEGAKFYQLRFDMLEMTYSIKAVSYNEFIYFIGATDGWNNDETKRQRLQCNNYDGVYTGFIYCADPNGWGNQFKFQTACGSWDGEINSGAFTAFEGSASDKGGNIGVEDGEGVYYFVANLAAGTISATKVEKMGIIGDFNSWGGDAEMTWNATDYCFEATGVGATANGWKFRVNADWAINLGGTTTKLVADGDNLAVDAQTVKLYPTRRTNENIYCTAE